MALLGFCLAQAVDVGELVRQARTWVEGLGPWGPLAFIVVYVLATLVAVPGLPFTLAAPALFGTVPAFAVMVVASSLSASVAFLVARYVAKGAVSRRLARNAVFAKVNRLLDEHAWIIIPFLRIVPFPFAVNNYGFGLTSISFWRYLAWSEVGMVPMNAALVLGADSVMRAAAGQTSWPLVGLAALAVGIVAVLVIVGRRAWTRLDAKAGARPAIVSTARS